MTTVDLYLRLSIDREGKDSLDRQESDLREWAAHEKLEVRKVWKDAGKSGYKTNVIREQFDAAVKAVSEGEVDVLAVWKLDRLSRRGAGQVGLVLDAVEEAGGRLVFLRDNLDTTVSNSRMLIIMVSEQARAESANTSLRVKAKTASMAAQGEPKIGVRPFGWEVDGMTIREDEADLIRDAVADYLSDEGNHRSMVKIASDWTEAGVLTDGMKRQRKGRDGNTRPARQTWTATTVRQVLQRERNAGLLTHQGEQMPKSKIAPIITIEELEALKAGVKVGTPMGQRAKTLLGGILRCQCGEVMHGTINYSQRKGGPRHEYYHYKCSQTIYDKTQKHASISQKLADDLLTAFILLDLFKGDVGAPADDARAGLADIRARLSANADSAAHIGGVLLDVSLKSLHTKARGTLKALDSERADLEVERDALLSRADQSGALAALMHEWRADPSGYASEEERVEGEAALMAAWESIGIERQRTLLKARYRPTVRVGGRGIERIAANPVGASTVV